MGWDKVRAYRYCMMWALRGALYSSDIRLESHFVVELAYSSWADFNQAQVLLIKLIEGNCDE
mgnify:CR=1 FL=1